MKISRHLLFFIIPLLLNGQSARDSLFLLGHQKEWTVSQTQEYKEWEESHFLKPAAGSVRQSAIMNGNKITTEIWNFGSISAPANRITDIIWEGLGYGYEFAPFVAAEVRVPKGSHADVKVKRDQFGQIVRDENGDIVYVAHIISDGLKSNGGEIAGDGITRWGWQPMVRSDDGMSEYLNLNWDKIPTSDDRDRDGDGKPDSWPSSWYNSNLRGYVWPGALGQGATNADKEAFFMMDDRDNKEFKFYPYPREDYINRSAQLLSGEAADDGLLYLVDAGGVFDGSVLSTGVWSSSDMVVVHDNGRDRFYHIERVNNPDTLTLKALPDPLSIDTTLTTTQYTIRTGLRKGLGLEVEGRYYQWSNVQAEDAIFLIYKIKNKGYYDLEKVIFGMWGDPHIGGPDDYNDDWANFDTQLEMTFAWDADGYSVNDPDIIPGYMGYKFLESPGVSNDGIDNDDDGMIDESWADGIDNDGDWDVDNDDVGIDGVPNTNDEGEKDGVPTAGDPFDITKPGEPNFEFTDIDESDMIGLTSFAQPLFTGLNINDDWAMWRDHIQPGDFDTTEVQGDYVFLYGSGIFSLNSLHIVTQQEISNAIKRFSIALLIGQDKNDLLLNAETVQRIYNSGYQFAKPPAKPTVTAIPGDRQVTLYWDNLAESSVDPISGEDFEGYIIYRSTDQKFLDQQTITDVNGTKFLFTPLKTENGADARFDLINGIFGPAKTPYQGRGVSFNLGEDNGLRQDFIDSNKVVNGQTYYYAVVSYDHGSDSLGVPPTECSKIITFDPTTNEYTYDINTVSVIPRRRVAGYEGGYIKNADLHGGIVREKGYSTGSFQLINLDDRAQEENNKFYIIFNVSDTSGTKYSVEDTKPIEETFISFYSNEVPLSYSPIKETSLVVSDMDGGMIYESGVDYQLSAQAGTIVVFNPDSVAGARMGDRTEYAVKYTYYPVYQSRALNGQLTNPVFDGLRLAIKESKFGLNKELSGWSASSQTDLKFTIIREQQYEEDPFDYEIEFFDEIVDTAVTNRLLNFKVKDVINNAYMKIATPKSGGVWEPGDVFFILRGGVTSANIVWQFLSNSDPTQAPQAGDLYYMATDKAFANGDLFSFITQAHVINRETAKSNLDNITVVPNPYVATNIIEPTNNVSREERGYRRLYFDHLPQQCTIRIYTQAGELVETLEHNSTIDDGKEFWDLLTKDNMEVAYGLYFFHIDAPGIGEKVGKFVIIK